MGNSRIQKIFTMSALMAAMIPAMQASAAGFQVSEHSAAGLGRAFAGEAAMADDASVVARNPAAMSLIDRTTVTVVGTYVKPEVKVEVEGKRVSGANSVAREAIVPAAYIVLPVDDKLTVGFGANTNFGFTTNYGRNSGVTMHADKSKVISKNFNGSAAYKFTDTFSAGVGLNAVHVAAELTSTMPPNEPGAGKNIMEVKGDDWAFGWNAGALWQVTSATRLGLSYRSEVNSTLDGKSKSDIYKTKPNWNSKGKVALALPAIAELSVVHQVTDDVSVQFSALKTYWSSFKEIRIKLDNGGNGVPIPVVDQQWKNVMRYSVATTWNYSDALTLRAGIAKDNSPVTNHRTFRIPDADRMWYTVGASYKLNPNSSVDFGYGYISGDNAKIDEKRPAPLRGEIVNSTAHLLSLQYNYRF